MVYGIVLEGGGAKGAFQIGFWQACRELGLEFGGVAGTSIGGINGALLVQGDIDKAYRVWSELTPAKVFNLDPVLYEEIRHFDITSGNLIGLFKYIRSAVKSRGLDLGPFRQTLAETIDEAAVRAAGLVFGIVTVNLTNLRPLHLYLDDIPPGKLIDYLLASARMPIFRGGRIDGKRFLDGGFYNNLPIDLLTGRGFTKIIAVRVKSIGFRRKIKAENAEIIYVEPSENLGPMLDVSGERIRHNIQLGYFDTLRVFRRLHGKRYYLEIEADENFFFTRLSELDAMPLASLRSKLLLPAGMPDKRLLFEVLYPLLAQLLEVDEAASYRDIVVALVERAAEKLGFPRFKIYGFKHLLREVSQAYRPQGIEKEVAAPAPSRGSELYFWPDKERALDEITKVLLPVMTDRGRCGE
jgi:NTE family protein